MRLRNVKGAKEIIDSSPIVIKNPSEYKGNFNKIFNNNNLIRVEIGMGKGLFIINMALQNPNINFIGIEKYDSVLVRALEKITNPIPNLRVIRMDAEDIDSVFYKEIDLIYLNFSDPWPKEKHKKRRLTSLNFLKKYDSVFKKNKKIIMKTDNRKLFEFSIIEFVNYNYKIENISLDMYKDDVSNNVQTEYEIKFTNLGNPIYKIEVTK